MLTLESKLVFKLSRVLARELVFKLEIQCEIELILCLWKAMPFSLLFVLLISVFSLSVPVPKSLVTASFNLNRLDTQLALDKAIREAQAWYEYELAWMGENLFSLPPDQQQAAVDKFMRVYCPSPDFKGFIGITGTGQLITNITRVSELYKANFINAGSRVTFNVKFYNEVISLIREESTNDHLVANITAFNEHVVRLIDAYGNENLLLVQGWYVNQWRIDQDGNMCLSRFNDEFLKVFSLEYTAFLSLSWNLKTQ